MALDPNKKKDDATVAYNRAIQNSFLTGPKGNVAFAAGQTAGQVANTARDLYATGKQNLQDNLVKTGATLMAPAAAIERTAKSFGAGLQSTQAPVPRKEPAARTAADQVLQKMPKREDYGLPPETKAAAYDRTGNSDPAVIAELAARRARQEQQVPAKKNYEDITSQINQRTTKGFSTAIPRAAAPAQEFAPGAELYDRAMRFMEAAKSADDGSFGGMVKAAIARNQGKRLLAASEGFTNIDVTNRGALQRAQMQEQGAMSRAQMQEEGAMQRTLLSGQNEANRARIAAEGQMANTQLQQQLSLQGKLAEMAAKENLTSTQVESMYKQALAKNASAEVLAKMQKYGILEAVGQLPGMTPERYASIAQRGIDPVEEAKTKAALAALTGNPLNYTPEARDAALRQISGGDDARFEALKILAARSPERLQAALQQMQGGQQNYAEGGAVNQPMAAPTMGMPSIKPQMQLVQDYRTYAVAAARLGATPIPFDQFANMKMSQTPSPAMGYAEGGMVDSIVQSDNFLSNTGSNAGAWGNFQGNQDKPRPAAITPLTQTGSIMQFNMKAQQPAAPSSGGMSAVAGPQAEPMRFANGGAIKVAGKQVLGPGTGKSDSIPAIIDGKKPAALSTGEYVFPVEAVKHYGLDKLNKMVEAARKTSSA